MQRQEVDLETGEQIRLDPKLVEKWESGEVCPRLFYQTRLCLLLEADDPAQLDLEPSARLELEIRRLRPPSRRDGGQPAVPVASGQPFWSVPLQRNPFFAGRQQVLDNLRMQLIGGGGVVAVTQHALCGLGGIGKTQIALEYAHRHSTEYEAVVWVRADTAQALRTDLLAFGRLIGGPAPGEKGLAAVHGWLSDHAGWLLVLDNVEDAGVLVDLLPHARHGHVIVTTRAQSLGGLAHAIQVSELSVQAGALLLLHRSGILPLSASLDEVRPADVLTACQLVHELGGLPLAIDQAAAFIEETSCSLGEYLGSLRQHRHQLMSRRGGSSADHPAPAATTLSMSLESLASGDPIAADLLRLCGFLDPDEIPEEILTRGAPAVCPTLESISDGSLLLHQAIASLRRFSLVTRNAVRRSLTVHRLVQACLQDGMDIEDQRAWKERAAQAVHLALPEPSTAYSSSGEPARAVQVLRASLHHPREADDRAAALWRLAVQQQVLGRLAASERSLQESLALCIDHDRQIDQLKAHQYLALLRAYQGLADASVEQITIAESLLGAENRRALGSGVFAYRALCAILSGDLDSAMTAMRTAYEMAERSDDARDTIRATWLRGRALTLLGERERSRANLDEAARSLAAALGLCREHSVVDYEADLLLASAKLGLVQGDTQQAVRLGQEALAVADRSGFRVLEADVRNLLAEVALRTGRRREALTHAQRALVCAECDGSPYCYQPAMATARRHLDAATESAG